VRPWVIAASLTAVLTASASAHADGPEPTEPAGPAEATPNHDQTGSAEARLLLLPWLLNHDDSVTSPFGDSQARSGLQLHLNHDFTFLGLPWSVRMSGSENTEHSAGSAMWMPLPLWRSELVVGLRAGFFIGAAVEASTAMPPTRSIVFGKKF
jgi:hypothetical protein